MILYGLYMNYDLITQKKQLLDTFRPLSMGLAKNLYDWFRVELTYTSNAIEGNTLTRRETAVVIEKGLTIGGKSLVEHLEATNHVKALDYVNSLIQKKTYEILPNDILAIHKMILDGIDDENAGRFRNIPVRISGSAVIMPNHRKVPKLMDEFYVWLKNENILHPVAFAGEAHYRLVSIHPFVDGNGRAARLLMNLILMMQGYPPAIIRKKDRLIYLASLEKAQLGGPKDDYDKIILKAANRSLDIYLDAIQNRSSPNDLDNDDLIKIGELANKANISVPTVRYWTKEGLLDVAFVTKSNYQLYSREMVKRCEYIKQLKKERLSIQEIKQKINASF